MLAFQARNRSLESFGQWCMVCGLGFSARQIETAWHYYNS